MKYKRVLLKLSGEALMGNQQYGIDPQRLDDYTDEIALAVRSGAQIAVVIGGGNIFRGVQGAAKGFDRVYGDSMGMLATVINSLAIQSSLIQKGIKTVLLSGIGIDKIADLVTGPKAIEYLEQGYVVVIGGGTGNPYFTTDTGSALRAIEIKADIILKGTRVDGIYTADPEKDPKATKFETITYTEAYEKNLKVMDLTAFTMCMENNMPMLVFNMNKKGNLTKVLQGENIGTLVTNVAM